MTATASVINENEFMDLDVADITSATAATTISSADASPPPPPYGSGGGGRSIYRPSCTPSPHSSPFSSKGVFTYPLSHELTLPMPIIDNDNDVADYDSSIAWTPSPPPPPPSTPASTYLTAQEPSRPEASNHCIRNLAFEWRSLTLAVPSEPPAAVATVPSEPLPLPTAVVAKTATVPSETKGSAAAAVTIRALTPPPITLVAQAPIFTNSQFIVTRCLFSALPRSSPIRK